MAKSKIGLKVGDTVILGEHEEINRSKFWAPLMLSYVGKTAKIIHIGSHIELNGLVSHHVDIDDGVYCWREVNMIILNNHPDACIKCDCITINLDHICCDCAGK